MSGSYLDGYGQALSDLSAEFAELADQVQREMNGALQRAGDARERRNGPDEDHASRDLADALRRKLGWMAALQVCLAAERRHIRSTTAA